MQSSMAMLIKLKDRCLSQQAGERPLFGEIVNTLSALRDSHWSEPISA
jgi:hypothetical protein